MKHFLSKVKKSYKQFMTGKSGFSLVELIVVIAIMAVMAAVLAPALLGYVEKSRMQKDNSAMDEVVNAMQLSLADQSIYDEVLEHSVWDNVSCYIDKKDESQFADCKVQLKAANGDKKEQYMFNDNARLLDETVYYAAGNMRGLTITWSPNESGDTYDFSKGILNKFVGRKTGLLSENPELYNRLRSVIGDKLDTTSQTYRNSDYTIFIRVGSTGGAEAVQQDAIQVWGQFNGTNLAEKDHKFELSSGRVVGTAGANDASNNQANNENVDVNFSEDYVAPRELTTLTMKTWNGLTNFYGSQVWTDGTNIYYSKGTEQYILNGDTWEPKTWSGLTNFNGCNVWSDGVNYYYSNKTEQYILENNTWKPKTWSGLTNFVGELVCTDTANIYFSNESSSICKKIGNFVLNGNVWESKTWKGLTSLDGRNFWTDGNNVYYTTQSAHYILNNDTWEKKEDYLIGRAGSKRWTDGINIYSSNGKYHYVFDEDTWKIKVWSGLESFNGECIWTDGTNYYYSNGSDQYVFS